MRLRFLASVIAAAMTFVACTRDTPAPAPGKSSAQARKPQRLAVPPPGRAYTGAYVDFGETEDNVTLEALENFERLVGKHQAVIGLSSYWGKQSFPDDALRIIASYGAVPLVYWNPWGRPFTEDNKPDRFNL